MSELANNQNFSNAFGDNIRDAFAKAKRERDALFEKMKKATGDAKKKLEAAVKREDERLKKMKREGGLFTVFNQITQKFNPAAAVPRAAGLALVRLNWMGVARKLYPALLSEEQLKAKNYDLENAKKIKAVWDSKVKPFWENLGGDISALKKATLQGFDKPIFKTKKVKKAKEQESAANGEVGCGVTLSPLNKWANEFDFSVEESKNSLPIGKGFSNTCEASCVSALIAAGGSIIISAINAMVKKAGAKDDPFVGGKTNDPELAMPPLSVMDEEDMKEFELAALEDRKNNGLDPGTYESEYNAIENKYSKFLGMPKPVGITVAVVGGLAILIGGFLLIKKLTK